MPKITNIENFRGGLSLVEPTNLEDNQFEVLKNMYYNKDKRVQTRRWVTTFGNSIGSDPITSYFFFQNDTDGSRIALATAGTNMYKYDEGTGNWNSIKSGLTAFETDGVTRTRWSFAVYLNKIYMCNGIDAYAEYDGTTYTELWAQPKVRYLRYMADSIYWAWEDANPSTVYATTAWAIDGRTLNANDIKVGWDELGRINGMLDLGNVLLIFKNKKIYSVSWDLSSSQAIDSQNGWFCHRAIKNVENAIMYYNDAGVDRVKPRNWVAWASALATEPLANDLRALLDQVNASQRNNGAGNHIDSLNNYYYSFDTNNDNVPDKTLVYSSLVWAWSQYELPAMYDYWYYIDSDWDYHYLIASANGGQMFEIETWFQDLWGSIVTELQTKKWDFWDIGLWKTFDAVDIIGLKNEWSEITVEVIVDWEIRWSAIIDDTFANLTSSVVKIGSSPIGIETIGWWSWTWADIDLFSYLIRIPMYASWPNIQVRMYSESQVNVWTLDRIKISRENETIDLFPWVNIW